MVDRIAILGGGIIGCLIAREVLQTYPETRLDVIERDLVGQGASQRSAGLHFPIGKTERVRRMSAFSQHFYAELKSHHPELPIYPVNLTVLAPVSSSERLREIFLDEAALVPYALDRSGPIRQPDGFDVWQASGCNYADVHLLVQDLFRSLRSCAHIREGVAVQDIVCRATAVAVTLSTGEQLEVDQLVLAPGPWINARAWRSLVATLGVRTKKVVAFHLDISPRDSESAILFQEEDAFLLPLRYRDHWLYSYTCQEWDVDPDTVVAGISKNNIRDAQAVLIRYAPELADACRSGRVFCDAYSVTQEPEIRQLGESGRIIFAGAANGSGYRLAPAIASEVVALIQQGNYRGVYPS